MSNYELARLASAASPRWSEIQIAVAGNPNVAQRASDFLAAISPAAILALLAENERMKRALDIATDLTGDVTIRGDTSKPQHSPTPWRVSRTDRCLVLNCHGTDILEALGDYADDAVWPRMEANARLATAAPDLLAAAQRSLSWLTSYPNEGAMGMYDQMRAAIAKATGDE